MKPAPSNLWPHAAGVAVAAAAAWAAYAPAFRGPFLFDDLYQPFTHPGIIPGDITWWLIRQRPVQMLSFGLNYWISGEDPFSYHVVNLLIHLVNALLVYRIVSRLAAGQGPLPSAVAAALFLLHPVQTESVSYISGRAYSLSALFFLAALALFLERRTEGLSWRRSGAVLALFAAALGTKEHTLTLPLLFLLTEYYCVPGGWRDALRRNQRLYLPLAGLGVAGASLILWVLAGAKTAGIGVEGVTPLAYFFTQCRLVFTYLRLFLFPAGQTVDPDVSISEAATLSLAALLLLVAAAWRFRKLAPLASYGFFAFLLLLAPTSSFIPIADPFAERRLYLPLLGLILIPADVLARLPRRLAATIALSLVLAAAVATHRRNQVWTSAIALWQDAVQKAPNKLRPRFQLAYAYYEDGRCDEATRQYEIAARLRPPDYALLVDWALALECRNDPRAALEKLQQAAALEQTAHVYAQIGMIHGKHGRRDEALQALATAARLDPNFDMTFFYRGNLHFLANNLQAAESDYRHAVNLNPRNDAARQALARVEAALAQARQP